MKSSVYIFIALVFFVFIILCSIVYMAILKFNHVKIEKKVKKLQLTFGKEILKQLKKIEDEESLDAKEIKSTKKLLRKKVYKKVFDNTIIDYNKNNLNKVVMSKFCTNYEEIIVKEIKKYNEKDSIKGNHLIYMLGEYKLNREYINEFLQDLLNTNSLYIRYNLLTTIAKLGDMKCFINAIRYISRTRGYVNNKVFIDIIGQFNGDKILLYQELLNNFEYFTDKIKVIIVEKFTNHQFIDAKEYFLSMLKDENIDLELRASIIRYFYVVVDTNVEYTLINILESESWELRALAAKALTNYNSKQTIDGLLKSITDVNWHVRYNSANSLLNLCLDRESLIDNITEKDDNFATDILFYVMFERKLIDYDEFMLHHHSDDNNNLVEEGIA